MSVSLKADGVVLRALEPEDIDFLYRLENDEKIWELSNTMAPYSKFILNQYLENAHRDIYDVKQLRLVICLEAVQEHPIGFIDLFDFDPKNQRVGVGIIIYDDKDRNKGNARIALNLIIQYAFNRLELHQIFANITEDNTRSMLLFEKAGFNKAGIKKDWVRFETGFKDEHMYQIIRK